MGDGKIVHTPFHWILLEIYIEDVFARCRFHRRRFHFVFGVPVNIVQVQLQLESEQHSLNRNMG